MLLQTLTKLLCGLAEAGTVKAILSSTLGGVVESFTITSPGAGYTTGAAVATLNDDGTDATGLTVDITVDGSGAIVTAVLNNTGSGYVVGQTLRIAGGTSMAVITITGVDNTPLASQAVSFQGVQAGTYLPVIVDYVLIEGTNPATLMIACH